MNTPQSALEYLKKKKHPFWMVKDSKGKNKGEYEGDDVEESASEFEDLGSNLMPGKYELTVRSSKHNHRGALTYDFEVYQYTGISTSKNNGTMDAQLLPILMDINKSLVELKMMLQANKEDQNQKFKDLGKALSDVFDEKEEPSKPLSPAEMIKGIKGLGDNLNGLKL